MTTYIGAADAARRLGITTATLYAYVSRGRISRRSGPDGRTSLFDVAEVERLADAGRRTPGPRPTIDVRVASAVTEIGESGIRLRGHDLAELARTKTFEGVAEMLWTGAFPDDDFMWGPLSTSDQRLLKPVSALDVGPAARLAVACHVFEGTYARDDAATAARRVLRASPSLLGSARRAGSFAERVAGIWFRRPNAAQTRAIETALVLLVDHGLATSTLAVRVATSVRATPYAAMAAGLATVTGPLHGGAAADATRFLERCANDGVAESIREVRQRGDRIPGFGHKVYRRTDPRFEVLIDAVREVGSDELVQEVVSEVGRVLPKPPNVDLAIAALLRTLEMPADAPLFAIARIAGWAAHHAEESNEAPLRFRGVSS